MKQIKLHEYQEYMVKTVTVREEFAMAEQSLPKTPKKDEIHNLCDQLNDILYWLNTDKIQLKQIRYVGQATIESCKTLGGEKYVRGVSTTYANVTVTHGDIYKLKSYLEHAIEVYGQDILSELEIK